MKNWMSGFFVLGWVALVVPAQAQVQNPIETLAYQMSNHTAPVEDHPLPSSEAFGDCSWLNEAALDELAERSPGSDFKFMAGQMYIWKKLRVAGASCIYLLSPAKWGLSREEARVLHLASHLNPFPGGEPEGFMAENLATPAAATIAASTTDNRTVLRNSTYPFGSLALVTFPVGSGFVQGSAVQVSSHVFVTAANVVFDSSTGTLRPGGSVWPSYNNPSQTSPVRITGFSVNPGYAPYRQDPNNRKATPYDVAFIDVAASSTPRGGYASFFFINSQNDNAGSDWGFAGTPGRDPWYSCGQGPRHYCSWWSGGIGHPYPLPYISQVGYPDQVGSTANAYSALTPNIYPYISANNSLASVNDVGIGDDPGHELVHMADTTIPPFIEMTGTVSHGDSGGPIIGQVADSTDIEVLGIATAQGLGLNLIAGAGRFNYNDAWFQNNVKWNPGISVIISQPADGGTYDASAVPTLVAGAGAYSATLQWYSDIDGFLGAGATLNVAGRLTPGVHNITAQTTGSAPLGMMTFSITVTAQPSSLKGTPSSVLVPASTSFGFTNLSWNSPSYSAVDILMTVNGNTTLLQSGGHLWKCRSSDLPWELIYLHPLPRRESKCSFGDDASRWRASAYAHGLRQPSEDSAAFCAGRNDHLVERERRRCVFCCALCELQWRAPIDRNRKRSCRGEPRCYVDDRRVVVYIHSLSLRQSFECGLYSAAGDAECRWRTFHASTVDHVFWCKRCRRRSVSCCQHDMDDDVECARLCADRYVGAAESAGPGYLLLLGTGPGSGSAPEPISVGEVAVLQMYAHGDHTVPLAALTVRGVQGALLDASSNPVIIPAGQTSTTWTLTWNAPGTSQVDLYGEQNLENSGQMILLGTGPSWGSATEPMSIGETATLWLYAHGDKQTPLATLQISGHR